MASSGTTLLARAIFLLGLFSTGCSQSHGFVNDARHLATPDNGSLLPNSAPTPTSEISTKADANVTSAPSPDKSSPGETVVPQTADFLPTGTQSAGEFARLASAPPNPPQTVWGILDLRGFPVAQQIASNGVEYNPLFLLDLDFNIMLWRQQHLYLFTDSFFWGQKAAPGITNPSQGPFDFSKREFDFNIGAAWNYTGFWEARIFAYSFNNLNRGDSHVSPSGFNDGVGIENRYYLGSTYANLGTAAFDLARVTFLSVGYYPTKSMVDPNGNQFKPGPFLRAYLIRDLWSERYYLFGDVQFIASRSFQPTLINFDAGLAARPFATIPRLEFRLGSQDILALQGVELDASVYLAIRYVY